MPTEKKKKPEVLYSPMVRAAEIPGLAGGLISETP